MVRGYGQDIQTNDPGQMNPGGFPPRPKTKITQETFFTLGNTCYNEAR